ncbi:MAG: hypothetical protein IPJ81_16570 [Chitinophagaceae bacterium]|nr:hypothetical protein [Chitinophagaceae bacterium]
MKLKTSFIIAVGLVLSGFIFTSCKKDPAPAAQVVNTKLFELKRAFVSGQNGVQEANLSLYAAKGNKVYTFDQLEANQDLGANIDFYYDDNNKQLVAPAVLSQLLQGKINAHNATDFKDLGLTAAEFKNIADNNPQTITIDFINEKLAHVNFPKTTSVVVSTAFKAYAFQTAGGQKGIVYTTAVDNVGDKATIKIHIVE